ncbi:MAG: IPT/TIG domain-containing protein [Syntrophomonadaceae bacterium]|nr:IPT/TIG domain-containing protein [Syntrophomonadaceae bacterium]
MAVNHRKTALIILLFVFFTGLFLLILSPPVLQAAVPAINKSLPLKGGIGGGYLAEITGTGFSADSIVRIDGKTARVMEFLPEVGQNPGRLMVEVPPGSSIGLKDVLILNPNMTWDLWERGFEYLPGPVINYITPNSGLVGSEIEVRGSNFRLGDTVEVRIGGILTPLLPGKPFTDTSLWVAAPAGLTGTVSLEVAIVRSGAVTDERTRIPAGFTYTAEMSSPAITEILPANTGLTAGGQELTIRGTDFRVAIGVPEPVFPRVYFGQQQAVVTSVTSSSITVLTPPNTAGAKNVLVVNPDGRNSNTVPFYYVISEKETAILGVTPNFGSREGGTPITISVLNLPLFDPARPAEKHIRRMELTIGGIPAGEYPAPVSGELRVIDSRTLEAITPGGSLGRQDIILWLVLNDDSTVQVVFPRGFEYLTPPSQPRITAVNRLEVPLNQWVTDRIEQLGPAEGPIFERTPIIITGQDFRSPQAGETVRVLVGLDQATDVTVLSPRHIYAVVPAGQVPAVKDITVINPDGASVRVRNAYTYRGAALRVDSVTPNFGPVSGGTEIVIRGASFSADLATLVVQFGYTGADGIERFETARFKNAADKVQTDGQGERMTVITPPHTQGWKSVRVLNIYGEYTKPNAFLYLPPVFSSPLITGLEPVRGPVTGGTSVVITGENFATGAEVRFGPVAVPPLAVTVESLQRIRVVAPPSVPGWQGVTVVNPDGQEFTWWAPPRDVNDPADQTARGFFYFSTPVITSLSPNRGAVAGGGIIEINGSQFFPGIRVVFGQAGQTVHQEVYEVHLVDSGKLRVRLPAVANPAGNLAVTVINKDGGSFTLPGAFSFVTATSLPQVERVVPDFGPAGGRIEALITGQNFPPNPVVYFGWESVLQVVSASANQLRVLVPANLPGKYPVTVINPSNMGAGVLADAFEYLPSLTTPLIQSVTPPRGSKAGGTYVTILGQNFWEGVRVFFGPQEVPRANVDFRGGTLLKVVTPPGELGPADVRVVNPDGGSALRRDAFTYLSPAPEFLPTIISITPDRGKTAGGTFVTIKGNNFWQDVQVFFAGLPALKVARIDRETITLETPPHPPGRVEVTVANQDGGVVTVMDGFEYLVPGSRPIITKIDPALGMAGAETPVTITGGDFRLGLQVQFGGIPGRIESVDYERIVVFTPRLPKGRVNVTVTNTDLGSVTQPNGFEFRSSVPRILSVEPGAGSREGGDVVYLTGNNLIRDPGFNLYFGNTRVPDPAIEWLDGQTLKIVTPPGPLGYVDVRAVNPDGEEFILRRGFLYKSPASSPQISGITPAAGPTAGGIWVTLQGTDFRQEAMVYFQGQPAARVRLLNSGELMALLPPYRPGEVDVTVVNYDGGSDTLAGAFTYRAPESNPRIDRVEPNRGPHLGGTAFTLVGLDFRPGIKVFFDGVEAAQVQFKDYRTVTGVAPPGTAGPKDVTVLNSDQGVFTLPRGFSYFQVTEPVITSVSPDQGPATGGTGITVTGLRFAREALVTVGGQPAQDLRWISDGILQMRTPPGLVGWREIRVINPDGGFTVRQNGFYYQRPRAAPDTPDWLWATTHDHTTLRLNWSGAEFAEYYEVFISDSSAGTYRFLAQTRETVHFATGLSRNQSYYFQVRAVNELGASSFSRVAHAWTGSSGEDPVQPLPQVRIEGGGSWVRVNIPDEDSFRRHHRIALNQAEYRQASRFIIALPGEVARAAPRNLVIDTGILQLNMAARALWTPGLRNLSGGELADTWVRVGITYNNQSVGEQALAAMPRGTRLLTPVVEVVWETQTGRRVFANDFFHGPVTLSLNFTPENLRQKNWQKTAVYYFDGNTQTWQTAPVSRDPFWPILAVDVKGPGRYVLVEQP